MLVQPSLLLVVVLSLCGSAAALQCALSTALSGIGEEIAFDSKLTVFGFSASVNYVTLPEGSSPYLKIVGASEQPVVSTVDGAVTISTDSCDSLGSTAPHSSSATSLFTIMPAFAAPRNMVTSLVVLSSIFGLFPGVALAQEACTPSLQIEIALPPQTSVTQNFGETDHYLAATVDTVTWGYYDPNATAALTINSGDTVTVEVITHHSGHDYAKMIRGDPAVEEIFAWFTGQNQTDKAEPKLPGSGVHLVTGPIFVNGAEPGDVIQVDILELEPRKNPATGKTYGTNSQKFAGYQYNSLIGYKRDGTQYVRTGGTEAITVMEFVETEDSVMLFGKPVYMYRFPNMTLPDGSIHTFDSNPSVTVPHEYNYGYGLELIDEDPIVYPPGFDGFKVTDEGGIVYLSPDPATLDWKVPLRPHLGTLAVMPNNTANYIDNDATGGASTIPPSRFGGNIDDWRIGKGGTMYYVCEVPGAMVLVGDTHAAQGDSELAGTAMETSMTTKLRITLHKKDSLPTKVATIDFPLLETSEQFVIHGFAYKNYLDELTDPSSIFGDGTSLDLAMANCFNSTRDWLMDTMGLIEEETIALMTMGIDFGVTQVVDGNWGVHADIPKWLFDSSDAPFDYTCTTSKSPGRRRALRQDERERILRQHGITNMEEYASDMFARVTAGCKSCGTTAHGQVLAQKLLDAKIHHAQTVMKDGEARLRLARRMNGLL